MANKFCQSLDPSLYRGSTVLLCALRIVQCLLNLWYYVIKWLHSSAIPRSQQFCWLDCNGPLSFRGLENCFMKKNIGVNCPLILNRHFSLLLIEKSILGTEDLYLNGIKWRIGRRLGSYVPRKLPTYPSPKPAFCIKWEVGVNDGLGEG